MFISYLASNLALPFTQISFYKFIYLAYIDFVTLTIESTWLQIEETWFSGVKHSFHSLSSSGGNRISKKCCQGGERSE